MSKARTHFLCRSCGGVQSQWMGKCPDCGTWDALERFTEAKPIAASHDSAAEAWINNEGAGDTLVTNAQAVALPDIQCTDVDRLPTNIGEFDRVLGGGLVPGSVILLGGDPGIGKSTLLLQAAGKLAQPMQKILYVTSEESAYQTRLRSERLFDDARDNAVELEHLYILADTNLSRIVEQARAVQPRVMVIDSIQMVFKPDLDASPGSVTQLRRCCTELVYLAKRSNIAIVLVGHVTKDGQLAGPKLLEHLVDAVLSFEGDRHHAHRVVRGIKNRFGTTLEVGLFEMTGAGLVEVASVSGLGSPEQPPRPGSAVCPAVHGTRALLVEIQALTATGFLGSAKRKTSGLDANRLAMLIAVLEKHGGLRLADQDIFTSAVGGLKVIEPAADLAIALAIAGAHYGRALGQGVAAVGEVGLGGEVRHVHQLEQRVREANRLGYQHVIVPRDAPEVACTGDLLRATSVSEALALLQ
jgi:DNA repair protein RadA/Sms